MIIIHKSAKNELRKLSYNEKENLLLNAILKFDEIKQSSNQELTRKISEIESVFLNINNPVSYTQVYDNR